MKRAIAVLLVSLMTMPVFAQKPKTVDKKFVAVIAGSFAVAVADEEVTQYLINKNPTLREGNPLLGDTRKTAYPVIIGMNALSALYAYKSKKSGNKYWFVPTTVNASVHGFAIGWNLTR